MASFSTEEITSFRVVARVFSKATGLTNEDTAGSDDGGFGECCVACAGVVIGEVDCTENGCGREVGEIRSK